jgi:23S rRNA (guanosine2251-2'-O)-methyltransferase
MGPDDRRRPGRPIPRAAPPGTSARGQPGHAVPRNRAAPVDGAAPGVERLIVGLQPVREVLRARRAAVHRLALDRRPSPRLDALARFARDQGVQTLVRLSTSELDALAGGNQHQGALAWAEPLELAEPQTLLGQPRLLALALDQVQDPQNFGAAIRSAVGVAGAPIVWAEHASAPLTPATFRASAGAIEHATLCRVPSLTTWLQSAREQDLQVLGLDAAAPTRLADCDLTRSTILVVGSEHEGLRRSVRQACSQLVSLVTRGAIDSLNASVAAAIALYVATEQRSRSSR